MASESNSEIESKCFARCIRYDLFTILVLNVRNKSGKDAEVSTALGVVPDMLVLDDECFIVDAVMLADEENDQGWMSVRAPEVSRRSLVGNGAYIPHGTVIPKNVFHANLGAFTLLMKGEFIPAKPSWRGCPAAMA